MPIDSGGPAFPRPASEDRRSGTLPNGDIVEGSQSGMSLRDWFAGQYIASIQGDFQEVGSIAARVAAEAAYKFADAMLEARSCKGSTLAPIKTKGT